MNKINKFLLIFLAFVVLLSIGIKQFFESKYFGSIITFQINKELKKHANINVDIGRIDFSLTPIQTTLKEVEVTDQDENKLLFNSVGVELSFWDIFRSDLRVSKIHISNGYIKLNRRTKQSNEKIDLYKILKQDLLEKIPFDIGEINGEGLDLYISDEYIQIETVKFRPYSTSIDFEALVKNINMNEIHIDSMLLKGEVLEDKVRLIDSDIKSNLTRIKSFGELSTDLSSEMNFEVEYSGDITEFVKKLGYSEYASKGNCECIINIKGSFNDPQIDLRGSVKSFANDYAIIDLATIHFEYRASQLIIKKAALKKGSGRIDLLTNIVVNINSKKVSEINARVVDMHSHDLLYFLGDDYKVFSSLITGDVSVKVQDETILISNISDLSMKNAKIGSTSDVLDMKQLIFNNLKLEVSDDLKISATGNINSSRIKITGKIKDSIVDIDLESPNMELTDLGGEVASVVSGKGAIFAKFFGRTPNVVLNMKSESFNNIDIYKYKILGKSQIDIDYLFDPSILKINKINNENGKITASGIVNLMQENLDINLKVNKLKLLTLNEYVGPVWKDIEAYVTKMDGVLNGDVKLDGSFSSIKVSLNVFSDKISLFNEVIKKFSLKMNVDSNAVTIDNLKISRDSGFFEGSLVVDFESGLETIKANLEGMKLNELIFYRKLGLGYDGVLNAKISYTEKKQVGEGGGIIQLLSSTIGRKKIKPSTLSFNISNNEVLTIGNILGERVKFNSKVYIGNRSDEYSYFNSAINIEDLKIILGILSLHNVYDTDLNGEFVAEFNAGGKLNDTSLIDIDLSVKQFLLRKFNKYIILNSKKPNSIKIEKSIIKDFSLSLEGNGGSYILDGSGDIKKKFKLSQNFSVDLSFLSLLSSKIERVGGRIFGQGEMHGNIKNIVNSHTINGENIALSIKNAEISLSGLSFKSEIKTTLLTIKELNGYLGSGKISGKGFVNFEIPYPKINLSVKLDDIIYPFANSSRLSLDGYFDFVGERFPYILRGNIDINAAKVEDEFTSFMNDSTSLKSVDKYIDIKKKGLPDIIKLDVKLKTADNIVVKNRLADILLYGDAKVSGDPLNPDIKGKVTVVPTLSKFKFKGNEFVINDGVVDYNSLNNANKLNLNFTSEAKINQYDIKMNIVGSEDDMKLNMESNPSLSKEDIFSLLTLGVTSDFTKNLEDKDRASLTTIGLGTLIVDQLKINEGLDSTLGLKLFVLPEVSENEDSPIKSSKNESSGRGRTATKLKIKKTISKKVGLTFSKTFGNDESNKQEMNIDFDFNDKWSIQGVFEKESDNDSKDNEDGSVGADVKYKWSF